MRKQRITSDDLLIAIKQKLSKTLIPNPIIPVKNQIVLNEFDFSEKDTAVFEDCIFVEKVTLYGNELKSDLTFRHCYFLKGIHLIDIRTSNIILLMNSKIKSGLIVSGCKLKHLATYATSIEHVLVGTSKITKLELGGKDRTYLKRVSILDDNSIGKIQIANSGIEEISFSYLSEDTEIFNCNINSLLFNKVRNNGNLKLLNCKSLAVKSKMSHFISNESNLGKAEFFQFDFSSFDEVNIINSVLNDCLFINTTWSDNIRCFAGDQMDNYFKDRQLYMHPFRSYSSEPVRLQPNHYRENIEQLKDKKEVYKQIKYALSKQGDTINEGMFHALEMNTYNRILDHSPKNITTKIILYLSYLSSNYGLSLIRPILFLIIVNGCFFSLLNFSMGMRFLPISQITFHNIADLIAKFLWYLNPFRESEHLAGIPLIIDIFMRIVSSYSIYNIIRASRRFIK